VVVVFRALGEVPIGAVLPHDCINVASCLELDSQEVFWEHEDDEEVGYVGKDEDRQLL